jgi:hypothetical protein
MSLSMPETFSCITLASASPRRRELLRQIGVNFKRLRPSKKDAEVDETPLPREMAGRVPQRYFLSSQACRGILRRASMRGKKLPGHLKRALEAGAGQTAPAMPQQGT